MVKNKINQNSNIFHYLLFTITSMLFLLKLKLELPNSDTYFLIATGKHIVENKMVVTINPFIIHDGFNMIIQQWGFDVLMYEIHTWFGLDGLFFYCCIIFAISSILLYKFLSFYSNNTRNKLLLLSLFALMMINCITTRPTSISLIIFLAELIILESYTRTKKIKSLMWLPIISMLMINIHASLWSLMFVFIIPYIFFDKIPQNYKTVKQWIVQWNPIYITMLTMFAMGFVNPNGFQGIAYIFKSYSSANIENMIIELQSPQLFSVHGVFVCISLMCLIYYLCTHKQKLQMPIVYMTMGTAIMAMMHLRNFWFLIFGSFPIILMLLDKIKVQNNLFKSNKIIQTTTNIICIILITISILLPITVGHVTIKDSTTTPVKAVECLNAIKNEDIVLFTEFGNGAFFEYYNYKVYIDARPELFQKAINGKENVYEEYVCLIKGELNIEDFLNRYQFTHLIATKGTVMCGYLTASDKYEMTVDGNGYCFFVSQEFKGG